MIKADKYSDNIQVFFINVIITFCLEHHIVFLRILIPYKTLTTLNYCKLLFERGFMFATSTTIERGFMFDTSTIIFGIIILIVLVWLLTQALFVVKQQHAVIIERLGKFQRIVYAGFNVMIPFIDRRAASVSLRTMKNGFNVDVKTEDNVTIDLEISAQYCIDGTRGQNPSDSGIYKSFYTLQNPADQMRDFLTDALRSAIPVYTLDEVFAKKDDIARDVNQTVAQQMADYGFKLVSTLITKIDLPAEVENSMNQINAAQRTKAAAQDLAEADRIKRVTEAKAEAEAMEESGKGIANQRKAIAEGIKDSLGTIQESGVSETEANALFMFTQWTEMMSDFAKEGKGSTVVLPSDFRESASMFEQMLASQKSTGSSNTTK